MKKSTMSILLVLPRHIYQVMVCIDEKNPLSRSKLQYSKYYVVLSIAKMNKYNFNILEKTLFR